MRKELFTRYEGNPILTVDKLPKPYKLDSVFNPAATKINDETLLLVRVKKRSGSSHLTLARSKDGRTNWRIGPDPTLKAKECFAEEWSGLEDPRITYLEEIKKYVIAYVSFSNNIPSISLATTSDFSTFERIIEKPSIPGDKDASLFPQKIKDYFVLIHRPNIEGSTDEIWLSFSKDLKSWQNHRRLFATRSRGWDESGIGLGPPPIWTPKGWIIIYHGTQDTASQTTYRAGLALLDLEELKVIKRSEEWVFGPKESYEGGKYGIVFPCGSVVEKKTGELKLYYGANDDVVALATANLGEVLDYLMKCPEK